MRSYEQLKININFNLHVPVAKKGSAQTTQRPGRKTSAARPKIPARQPKLINGPAKRHRDPDDVT
jgi:hypothetical protein